MTTGEFADLVGSLRRAQIVAAKTRTPTASLEAMRLEREVDRILLERLQRTTSPQPNLPLEGGNHEPATKTNQHLNTEPPLASGRGETEPRPLRHEVAGNEQQGARWAQSAPGETSDQLDIW